MGGLANYLSSSSARKTSSYMRLHKKRTANYESSISLQELARRPDPFFVPNMLDGFEESKYGQFANGIRELRGLKRRILAGRTQENLENSTPVIIIDSDDELPEMVSDSANNRNAEDIAGGTRVKLESDDDDDDDAVFLGEEHRTVAVEFGWGNENEHNLSQNCGLDHSEINEESQMYDADDSARISDEEMSLSDENNSEDGKREENGSGDTVSPQIDDADDSSDESSGSEDGNPQVDDGLDGIWAQMAFELESSKPAVEIPQAKEQVEDCEHSFIYKEDLGEVCRVCGIVRTHVDSMIDVVFNKPKRLRRSYMHEAENVRKGETSDPYSLSLSSQEDSLASKMSIHLIHQKQMRPHQIEGFNFLRDNLVTEAPGGCILAHTPGSGKTFLIISFMQSFMAVYPHAKPLIVLPKGIIETWKREFTLWAVEDFPLLDFYSAKADSRTQQLDVLKKWIRERSILFLGYSQFSSIICDFKNNDASEECQRILLKAPTLLILDEGHTSRNDETNVLNSLARVETPRKVVLTGTLFQNHVKEVFNIFNLVRPKFLRLPESREFFTRIMSKIEVPNGKRNESTFYDGVENTLKKSDNASAKASVIKDLREMTRKVLHYHKADFSRELPGLVEFTVMLNLCTSQRDEIEIVKKMDNNFKQKPLGSALYMHPKMKAFLDQNPSNGDKSSGFDNEKIDEMLENINVQEGVKMKFFLNLLSLCESKCEKLLVFSHYVFPLKTLERLLSEKKGWSLGKDMFTITGDSSNEQREWSMERFNTSPDAKVFFGSIKACGEGISLVGASRVLILDVHLNPSVTQQAVARAYRPGQKKKVYSYRLVAADSPEEDDYKKCSSKEIISKMWFEWNVGWGRGGFEFGAVDVDESGDEFLETPRLMEDIKALYIR